VYASLYKKMGVVVGRVQFDRLQPLSDVSGTLFWSRPAARAPVHPDGFEGPVQLKGVKYIAPAKGQRLFLNPNGTGLLTFDAPASGGLSALEIDSAAVLDSQNQLTALESSLVVKASFNAATGLFNGSFLPLGESKRLDFSGVALIGGTPSEPKGNVAGGYFIRGDRTGAVQLTEPVQASLE